MIARKLEVDAQLTASEAARGRMGDMLVTARAELDELGAHTIPRQIDNVLAEDGLNG